MPGSMQINIKQNTKTNFAGLVNSPSVTATEVAVEDEEDEVWLITNPKLGLPSFLVSMKSLTNLALAPLSGNCRYT
jgi:hypothetical protein